MKNTNVCLLLHANSNFECGNKKFFINYVEHDRLSVLIIAFFLRFHREPQKDRFGWIENFRKTSVILVERGKFIGNIMCLHICLSRAKDEILSSWHICANTAQPSPPWGQQRACGTVWWWRIYGKLLLDDILSNSEWKKIDSRIRTNLDLPQKEHTSTKAPDTHVYRA